LNEMILAQVRHGWSAIIDHCHSLFSIGTSSKSTKLVHGGVRYLQKAIFELDYDQYKLVREALHERRIFLQTAPYLSSMLPIMLPVYKYWQVPYYWAGSKLYDLLAGKENMESSYLMSKGKALETFPMLNSTGLIGAIVYYDGISMFDVTRSIDLIAV
jgi:glycerol-3-phosphate dehydrogenase